MGTSTVNLSPDDVEVQGQQPGNTPSLSLDDVEVQGQAPQQSQPAPSQGPVNPYAGIPSQKPTTPPTAEVVAAEPQSWFQRMRSGIANSPVGRSIEASAPRVAGALGIEPTESETARLQDENTAGQSLEWHPVEGAKTAVEGMKNLAKSGIAGVNLANDYPTPASINVPAKKPNVDQAALGATQTMSGTMEATKPLMVAGIAAAPFRSAVMYGAGIIAGKGAAATAKAMGATPNEQEFFHTAGFFLPDTMVKAAGIEAMTERQGNTERVRATGFGGRMGVTVARNPEAVGVAGNVGNTRFAWAKARDKGVNFSDQGPTGIPAPPDAVSAMHDENAQAITSLAKQSQQTNSTAEVQSGLPPEGPPKPKPGEPGSTEIPMPEGMADGALTQQTVDHVGTAISRLPQQLKPQGILETVRNLAKWIRTKGTIVGPDNKLSQVTGQSPSAQDQSAQTIATKLVNDQIEKQNQEQQQAQEQEQERQETQQEEEQAAIDQTTEGAKPAKEETPKVEIPRNNPQVIKMTAALQGAPKGATAAELDRIARSSAMVTTPIRKALVQEEISRRANAKEQTAENAMNGETPAHGLDRENIQQWADKVAKGEHPYVFVPAKSGFKPNGVNELTATKVKGSANPAFDGTYYHAEDIKPGDIRKAARDKQDPQAALDKITADWKNQQEPVELGENEVEQAPDNGGENLTTEADNNPAVTETTPEEPQNTAHPDVQQIVDAFRSGGKQAAASKLDEIAKAKKLKDYEALMLAEAVKRELAKEPTQPAPTVQESTPSEKPAEKPAEEAPTPEKNEQPAPKVEEQHTFRPGQKVLVKQSDGSEVERQIRFKHNNGRYVVKGEKSTIPAEQMRPAEEAKPEEKPAQVEKQEETAPGPEPVEAKDHGINSLVNAIYQKLEAGESLGNVTELTKLAEKHMGSTRTSGEWSPKDMFDAMEAAVNRYLIAHGARWMEMDGHEALAELRDLMKRLTTQGTRTEEQIKKQQFSTPPTESYVAARAAAVKPSDVVLEPSAGNGGLAAFPKSIGAEVYLNEIAERRQDMLRAAGFGEPTAHNGEVIHALLDQTIKPTVIIMNPPFSAGALGGRNRNVYGFNHVEQALQRLQPNGRLVAILGGGQANEPEGGASLTGGASGEWFKKLGKMYNVRANIRVNGKEYAKYGTAFATRIIVIDKDGPTKDLANVVQKNVDTLEEAYDALQPVIESRPETGDAEGLARPEAGNGVAANSEPGSGSGGRTVQPRGSRGTAGGTGNASVTPANNTGDNGATGRVEPANGSAAVSGPVEDHGNEPANSAESGSGNLHEVGRTGEARGGLAPETDIERIEHGEHTEQEDASSYVKYKPSVKGAEHPGAIVESKTMATVPLPPLTYKPSLPADTAKEKLSAVQLEPVILVGQANEQRLQGTNARSTCLIGDGTGVGKGREAAGIIFDNWNKGRKRLIWVSQTWDLMQAAIRDLTNVGAGDLAKKILGLNKTDAIDELTHEGVIYTTYALMRSGDKKGNTRIAQIQKWLRGEDEADGAFILFDESHNLKNAVVGQGGQASQIGTITKKLLEDNPNLRMSALSATAASDVMNLGYLDRLGLWGPGTSFPGGFWQFVSEIGGGGLSAMELIARELKAQGRYISRTLSFVGPDGKPVTYDTIDAPLTEEQKDVYRVAARAWGVVNQAVDNAIKNITNGGGRQRGMFMSQFYSAQQRFFNILLTTLKIPSIVPKIEEDLKDGKSVVITLVNTNEAAQNREKDRVASDSAADPDEIPDYDFGPSTMLTGLVHNYFPTQQYMDGVSPSGAPIKIPVVDADGNPVHNPEAIRVRDELEAQLKRELKMPGNPLDILIEALGGPSKVAEMTGRKEYYDEAKGQFVPRGDKGTPRDKVNLNEMAKFQSGKKRIALLSNAAGTGIDLHASLREKNQQKRSHYTLQAGWSADKQMQMFGRTHRTEEASAPEYHLVQSDMGGEKRFIATIAKRLGSLNAISKGQKDAGAAVNVLDKVNFESEQGRQAAMTFYNRLLGGQDVPGAMERVRDENGAFVKNKDGSYKMEPIGGREILRRMFVVKQDPVVGETVPDADKTNVTRLLNRLLALDPDYQNAVYDYYYDIFSAIVERAIEDGTLDTGVKDLPGDEHTIAEEKTLSRNPSTGAATTYSKVESKMRNARVSPEELDKRLKNNPDAEIRVRTDQRSGEVKGVVLTRPAPEVVHADGRTEEGLYVATPANGKWTKVAKWQLERETSTPDEVYNKPLKKAQDDLETAKRNIVWQKQNVERYKNTGSAAYYQTQVERTQASITELEAKVAELEKESGKALDKAKEQWAKEYDATPSHRTHVNHMIGGSVLPWWAAMREVSRGRLDIRTALDAKTGKRVVGVNIPSGEISRLLARISGGRSTVTARTLREDVLRNGTEYRLEGNIRVLRGRIAGNQIVRLVPPSTPLAEGLKQQGVLYERGAQPMYYIPDGPGGEQILNRVLQNHPVQQDNNSLMSEQGSATIPAPVQAAGEYLGKAAAVSLKDAIHAAGLAGHTMKEIGRDIVAGLYPRALASEQMKDIMGKAIGTPALDEFRAGQVMDGIDKMFNSMDPEEWTDFVERYQNGEEQPTQDLKDAAELMRSIIEGQEAAEDVAVNLGRKPSQRVQLPRRENYFPQRWKVRPGGGTEMQDLDRILKMASRRPMEGSKKFLKQRKVGFREGIEAGGKPLGNPFEMLMKRIQEGSKFVAAKYMMYSGRKAGLIKYLKKGNPMPPGWTRMNDKMAQVWRPVETEEGGVFFKKDGEWILDENFGRLVNNYLSRDLVRDTSAGQALAKIKNVTTNFRLSWSAFHWGYITLENFASGLNIGLDKLYNGGIRDLNASKAAEGLADIGRAILQPYTAVREGGRMLDYAKNPDQFLESPEGRKFVEMYPNFPELQKLLFEQGLRWGQNQAYKMSFGEGMAEDFKGGHVGKGMLKFFPWLSDVVMKPLFEHYIPRSKWTFAVQMLAHKLEQYSEALASGEATRAQLARQVVDATENRFGELNYDSLYWNNTFRTATQILMRSASWKLGTWRGLLKAGQETANALKGTFTASGFNDHVYDKIEDGEEGFNAGARRFTSRLPELGINTGWLASMSMVAAMISTAMVALLTGKAIWNWAEEDHQKHKLPYLGALIFEALHPRIGKKDTHGEPVRLSFPTGLKDYEHAYLNPMGYVRGSLSDVVANGLDTVQNKDWAGNYVYNPNDPVWQELLQGMKYNLKGDFLPMSVSNYRDQFGPSDVGSRLARATGLVGGSPKGLDRTAALRLALQLREPHTPETPEQEEAYRLAHANPSIADYHHAKKTGNRDYLQRVFMQLSYPDALKVWNVATPEERQELKPLLYTKRVNMMRKERYSHAR